ncbi:MAG TPA: BPL-N domain-containing protein [Trueperaceae bacterium]
MGPLRNNGPARHLAGLRVGVYGSGGAPWHHLALAAVHGADVRVVRAEDLAAGRLADLNALVFPGGGALAMSGLMAPLGEAGARTVHDWVQSGGTYVGSCAGSVLPIALTGPADAAIPAARCLRLVDVPMANVGDETLGGLASPGVGRIVVRLNPAHPYAAGLPERVELVHYNGPLFDMARAGPDVRPFGWPVEATESFTPAERFLETPDELFTGETTFDKCVANGAATAIEAPFGSGHVVLFGSHPEFGLGALGLGWSTGARLLVSALAATRDRSPRKALEPGEENLPGLKTGTGAARWAIVRAKPGADTDELAAEVAHKLWRAAERFAALSGRKAGAWLAPGFAAAFHGVPAKRAWTNELRAAAAATAAAAEDLETLLPRLDEGDVRWLDDEPRVAQDFGAMGLLQLVDRIHAMLDRAEGAIPRPAERPAHAYDLFDTHPFHLAMGSYLSAAGLAAAALLTVVTLAADKGTATANAERLLWA